MTMMSEPIDLEPIKARLRVDYVAYRAAWKGAAEQRNDDIAALIAEVERLRGAVMYASNFAEDSQQIRYFEGLLPPRKP